MLYAGTCVRQPPSNSPITSVLTNDIRCNVNGAQGVAGKCAVNAGGTVTIEMHQVKNKSPPSLPPKSNLTVPSSNHQNSDSPKTVATRRPILHQRSHRRRPLRPRARLPVQSGGLLHGRRLRGLVQDLQGRLVPRHHGARRRRQLGH